MMISLGRSDLGGQYGASHHKNKNPYCAFCLILYYIIYYYFPSHTIILWSYYTDFVPLCLLRKYISTYTEHRNMVEYDQKFKKAEHVETI